MTRLLERIAASFRRLVRGAAPAVMGPTPQRTGAGTDGIAFSCTIGGVTFVTDRAAGLIYFFDQVLDYDLPPGETVELIAGGPLNPDAVWRSRPDLGATIHGVTVHAVADGAPLMLRLHQRHEGGASAVRERPIITGRTAIRMPPDESAFAVSITLVGTGRISFKSLRVARVPAKPAQAATTAPADPLVALVQPDYLAARKAGAEIPPPPLVGGF